MEVPGDKVEFLARVLSDEERLLAVPAYLCRVGEVPAAVLSRGYDALVAYIQGRLD